MNEHASYNKQTTHAWIYIIILKLEMSVHASTLHMGYIAGLMTIEFKTYMYLTFS